MINVQVHPGYMGMFTRDHYPGAAVNGTRVTKQNSETGDGTANGERGTVLGSMGHPEVGVLYFVEWDSKPKMAVGVLAQKLAVSE